jgi:hypothetical protein
LSADQRAALDRAAATVVAALGGDEQAVPLDVAFNPTTAGDGNLKEPVVAGRQRDPHTVEFVAYPYVATPELLARYGIDPASVAPSTELLTGLDPTGLILADFTVRPDAAAPRPPCSRSPSRRSAGAQRAGDRERVARHGWTRPGRMDRRVVASAVGRRRPGGAEERRRPRADHRGPLHRGWLRRAHRRAIAGRCWPWPSSPSPSGSSAASPPATSGR